MPTQISADDIAIHGSTGSLISGEENQDETDPKKFLGGRPALFTDIPSNLSLSQIDLDNVFASVGSDEALAGSEKYRCLYVMNNHPTTKISHIYIWITKTTTAADDEIFLGRSGIFNHALESTSGRMVDFGGPIMSAPKIWLIFWGSAWSSSSTTPSKLSIEQSTQDIINSGYYNSLSQYRGLQNPTWGGSYIYTKTPPNNFDYPEIRDAVMSVLFSTPGSPIPNIVTNPSVLPIIIPHPKVRGSTSLTNYAAGFHSWSAQGDDSRIPANIRIPWGFSFPLNDPQQSFASVITHEIAEVMTDPKFTLDPDHPEGLSGFTSPPPLAYLGEVADVCVFTAYRQIGNVKNSFVEPYWSNNDNACIIDTGATGKTYFTEQVIPNENTAPDGVVFGQPFNTNPLHLSNLDPNHAVGFWLKRVVNAEADTTLNNRFTLRIQAQI